MSVTEIALFCGSRNWSDRDRIKEDVDSLPETTVVIHGGAPGADTIAGEFARMRGLHVAEVPALWGHHGKAAGPLRNEALMALGPTVAYAYPLPSSKGTWDMVRNLKLANVPVFIAHEVLSA